MTIKELKQILNSTTEWDDSIVCAAVVLDGMGSTTPITEIVIDNGAVYIGNDSEGCDYATTTKKDYYGDEW